MATQLTQMTGKEFIEKILGDERDFSGISLPYGCDLTIEEGFPKLNEYLKRQEQELIRDPVNLTYSCLGGIVGSGLHFPFIIGNKLNLSRANLEGANLTEAKNLDTVLGLETAIFSNTRVSQKEKDIIENALKKRNMFVVE